MDKYNFGTMNTYTGRIFDPLEMTPEDVCAEDIAHALSLSCRGCGQIRYFFSVAQHSINCAKEARERGWSKRVELACLLHDASEAYIADIIRPVKRALTEYFPIEDRIMQVILTHFGLGDLTAEETEQWKAIDNAMLLTELKGMLAGFEDHETDPLASSPDLHEHALKEIEQEFLDYLAELTACVEKESGVDVNSSGRMIRYMR